MSLEVPVRILDSVDNTSTGVTSGSKLIDSRITWGPGYLVPITETQTWRAYADRVPNNSDSLGVGKIECHWSYLNTNHHLLRIHHELAKATILLRRPRDSQRISHLTVHSMSMTARSWRYDSTVMIWSESHQTCTPNELFCRRKIHWIKLRGWAIFEHNVMHLLSDYGKRTGWILSAGGQLICWFCFGLYLFQVPDRITFVQTIWGKFTPTRPEIFHIRHISSWN